MAVNKFVTVNGIKLHFLDHGEAARPPLVCIHGLSGNAHNFDGLAPYLSGAYQVVALDVRGRGDSQWGQPGDYTPGNYVSDLVSLLDQLEIERVTLIGTSMGGIISMMFAGGYPERVERLVLNDIGPETDPVGLNRITNYMTASPSEFNNLDEVAAYYRENYPPLSGMADDVSREFVRWTVKPAENGKLTWKMDPAIRNLRRTGTAARAMDLWVPYARITAPILVVRGGDSDILSAGTARRMCAVLRSTRVVEVPGVGHAPSLLEPEALTAIKEFLLPSTYR
ncbi:MAG: alpha/beta fold hydrolase [Candidatus Binataceae bacterium]